MLPTLDVRAAGACAPRGIRIPATALKGRRPRPLDDGGSDLHREHRIVAAAIRTSSGEYGAKRLAGQGREMHPIRTVVAGALVSAMALATYQLAAAGSTATATLKNAFKRLRNFYDKVANRNIELEVTSATSVRRFAKDVERAGKDVSRLFTYLEDQCGVTFESPPTTT